jgi:hypothetical protein
VNFTTVPLRSSGVEVEVSASVPGVAGRLTAKTDQSNSHEAKAENSESEWSKLQF